MSACRYCTAEVVWVPTVEGARPFTPPPTLSPDAPVVVMKQHDCEARRQFLAGAAEKFMQDLYRDPMIRSYALTLRCPTCDASPDHACFDLRRGQPLGKTNKNPHKDRMIAGARYMQEHGVQQ